jgi:hypothetical protein
MPAPSRTEEEKVKAFFDYTNRGWAEKSRLKWEQLSDGAKYLWTQRFKDKTTRSKHDD